MNLKEELQKIVQGEVIDDAESLKNFSKDASIFEITPKIIVAPKNSEDIKAIIKFINNNPELKLSVIPRSAGTDMSGGAIGEGIILDITKHLNQLIEIKDGYATVQPGMFYRDFEIATLKQNLILPCYTASREINTVGGMVGNNSAGEKTLSYGQTEHYVKELKVVLADGNEYLIKPLSKSELDKKLKQMNYEGEVYQKVWDLVSENETLIKQAEPKVSKNSTGYNLWKVWDGQTFDLTKLITGSQGTLGVITEIKFELVKPKSESVLLVAFLKDLNTLDKIVNNILETKPESFECYDNQTLHYAVRFMSEISKSFKYQSTMSIFLNFLPDMINDLLRTHPKLVLLANYTSDSREEGISQAKSAQQKLNQFGLKTKIAFSKKEAEKYWIIRHESFNLLRHHAEHMRSAPFIDDIIVKPEVLPEFLPKLNSIIKKYQDNLSADKFLYTVAGHIGDGNFHIIPLMDFNDPQVKHLVPKLSEEIFDLVFAYKGSMAAEHNDGLVRGPFLPKMFGENVFQLFKEVKEIFDLDNIFNPNKKTDATIEYSYKHLSNN